jgi:hypothetical protein
LPVRDRQVEQCARQALALLERARQAGYFRRASLRRHLNGDPDLDALRGRADFQAWRNKLDDAAPAP